jgi:hypothetical protein
MLGDLPVRFPARYTDAHGAEETTITNDGRTLRTVVRGIEFSGSDFDGLDPQPGLSAAERASFSFVNGALTDCEIEWIMPLHVTIGDRTTVGFLEAHLSLGSSRSGAGRPHEILRLTLEWDGGVARSRRDSGWFEDELADIQAQLPEGTFLRCCFTCAFSDYHPVGHGLFGCLACFRDNKEAYLRVRSKADLWPVWPTMTEFVQETFVCPEFQRRVPGTGYRG